jgi:hypothetical protein
MQKAKEELSTAIQSTYLEWKLFNTPQEDEWLFPTIIIITTAKRARNNNQEKITQGVFLRTFHSHLSKVTVAHFR